MPRTKPPRTKPPRARRADLLDAAQTLFVERGIAATTLDEITRRAGVAKGTFYLYFPSKEHVVVALQQRFSERFAARTAAAVAAQDDWGTKLDALVEASLANYGAEHDLHDVLYHHSALVDEHDREPDRTRLVDAIRDLLAAGVAAGAYDVADVDVSAILVYSALHGAFDPACHGPRRPDHEALLRTARQHVRRAAGLSDVDGPDRRTAGGPGPHPTGA